MPHRPQSRRASGSRETGSGPNPGRLSTCTETVRSLHLRFPQNLLAEVPAEARWRVPVHTPSEHGGQFVLHPDEGQTDPDARQVRRLPGIPNRLRIAGTRVSG
jgi:hypothetical protein